jgi:hypothetical protein
MRVRIFGEWGFSVVINGGDKCAEEEFYKEV